MGLFGSHAKNKYSIFGTFYYNDFNAQENGGLRDVDVFLKDSLDNLIDYDTRLSGAQSHYQDLSLFATQNLNWWRGSGTPTAWGISPPKAKRFPFHTS